MGPDMMRITDRTATMTPARIPMTTDRATKAIMPVDMMTGMTAMGMMALAKVMVAKVLAAKVMTAMVMAAMGTTTDDARFAFAQALG